MVQYYKVINFEGEVNLKEITKQTIKLNLKILYKFKFIVAINTFVWLGINMFPLILSLIIREIFNVIEANNKMPIGLNFLFIVLAIFSSLTILWGGKVDTICRFKMSQLMKKNFIMEYIKNRKVNIRSLGEIMDIIMEDISAIEELISVEIDLLCKLVFAISAFFILIKINMSLTLFALIPMLIVSFIISKIGDKIKNKHYNSRQSNIDYNAFFSEIITNRESIQLLDAEEDVIQQIVHLGHKRAKDCVKQSIFLKSINEMAFLSYSVSVTLILFIAIPYIINQQLTIGDFSLFLNLIGYIGAYNNLFSEVFCAFKYMENSIERVGKILESNIQQVIHILLEFKVNLELDRNMSLNGPSNLMFFDFRLGTRKSAVKEFEIRQSEFFVVCGKSESGKSRFMDAILGYCSYKGTILIGGVNKNDIDIEKEISLVPQEPGFIHATIEENIGLVNEKVEIEKYLKFVNLNNEINLDYNDIGVNAKKLSDGQRQRLAIARGLAHATNIIILDDATSFLDYKNEMEIVVKLKKLQYTIIMISNRKNVLEQADRILVMDQGGIDKIGVKDELLESSNVFREIYNS